MNNLPLAIPFVLIWIFPGVVFMKNKIDREKAKKKFLSEDSTMTPLIASNSEKIEFKDIKNSYSTFIDPHLYIKKLFSQSDTYSLLWTLKIGIPLVICISFLSLSFSALLMTNFNIIKSISLLNLTVKILLIPTIFITPIFIPILILLNYKIPSEFKNMIESLSLGDFKGLSSDIEIYESSNEFKAGHGSKFIYWYCKSNLLIYLHKFSEALDILNNKLKDSNKKIAFYQEILFLMGNCFAGLGDIEKAKKLYNKSFTGFKKFKIPEPKEFLEKYLDLSG